MIWSSHHDEFQSESPRIPIGDLVLVLFHCSADHVMLFLLHVDLCLLVVRLVLRLWYLPPFDVLANASLVRVQRDEYLGFAWR